jgi:hypothetical protein
MNRYDIILEEEGSAEEHTEKDNVAALRYENEQLRRQLRDADSKAQEVLAYLSNPFTITALKRDIRNILFPSGV